MYYVIPALAALMRDLGPSSATVKPPTPGIIYGAETQLEWALRSSLAKAKREGRAK